MLLEYGAKFLAGGLLVCVFAMISQVCQPKQFAGIFSAAPSVLLAGLTITLLMKGAQHAALTAEGAIAGAVGMVFYCMVVNREMKRHKALVGSIISLSVWLVASFVTFGLMSMVLKW